jgi:fatty-acyl-CoA synthase
MKASPTRNSIPLRFGDFKSLAEALDYAALGETGYNFYNGRGQLETVIPYAELRQQALAIARRLQALKLERGARVALVADTHPDFVRFFFACQYAGMVPVPVPASINLGGHKAYVDQLRRLILSCKADVAISPPTFIAFLSEAAEELSLRFAGTAEQFMRLPEDDGKLLPSQPHELAYLQYTSGSTRFPRGVMITHSTVMDNLSKLIQHGAKLQSGDRIMSWLPFFHDMGLVGMVLSPMAAQMSVDFLSTRDFGMRPRLWLTLITQNKATLSFSPPFGYELCMQRLRDSDIPGFDLSCWRVAGVGAETIRHETLDQFAERLAPAGFNSNAFLPCYGMAECSLGVSFAELGKGIDLDIVDLERLAEFKVASPVAGNGTLTEDNQKSFVNCGLPLPGFEIEIRDPEGNKLADRRVGTLFVKGPSVMSGYFGDEQLTRNVLSSDGWLNTGDLAYCVNGKIFITGREKDLIIINGRNIWPQDLEYLAEQFPEVRIGDASAFSVSGATGEDYAVLVIECRESDMVKRSELVNRLQRMIRKELGIDCHVELVPRNTLPRTTSGKLSRSKAKKDFLQRVASGQTQQPGATRPQTVFRKVAP